MQQGQAGGSLQVGCTAALYGCAALSLRYVLCCSQLLRPMCTSRLAYPHRCSPQAAKSLGATLRSFAPTIREITSVSQELKSTLENVG